MLFVERLHDSIPLSAVILNHLNGKKHCHCLFSGGGGGGGSADLVWTAL